MYLPWSGPDLPCIFPDSREHKSESGTCQFKISLLVNKKWCHLSTEISFCSGQTSTLCAPFFSYISIPKTILPAPNPDFFPPSCEYTFHLLHDVTTSHPDQNCHLICVWIWFSYLNMLLYFDLLIFRPKQKVNIQGVDVDAAESLGSIEHKRKIRGSQQRLHSLKWNTSVT